jgi:hypothetical protein
VSAQRNHPAEPPQSHCPLSKGDPFRHPPRPNPKLISPCHHKSSSPLHPTPSPRPYPNPATALPHLAIGPLQTPRNPGDLIFYPHNQYYATEIWSGTLQQHALSSDHMATQSSSIIFRGSSRVTDITGSMARCRKGRCFVFGMVPFLGVLPPRRQTTTYHEGTILNDGSGSPVLHVRLERFSRPSRCRLDRPDRPSTRDHLLRSKQGSRSAPRQSLTFSATGRAYHTLLCPMTST